LVKKTKKHKARYCAYFSSDIWDFEQYRPERDDNFGFDFWILVKVEGLDYDYHFIFYVCTPSFLSDSTELFRERPVFNGCHRLFMKKHDPDLLLEYIKSYCNGVEGETWQEIAEGMWRLGAMEDEDFKITKRSDHVTAELRGLFCNNNPSLGDYRPLDEGFFGLKIEITVGVDENDFEKKYWVYVCTTKWFEENVMKDNPIALGFGHLFVERYDYDKLFDFLKSYVQGCKGTWDDVDRKMGRLAFRVL
jgi:hypothetical protein